MSEILNYIHYATLATVSGEGKPYNAPVFFVYDDELNLYWSSSVKAQHSKNINHNGKVYIVVYDSTVAQGTGWGVYMQAEASLVQDDEEVDKALRLLGTRRDKPFGKSASEVAKSNHKIYKAMPLKLWINDSKQDQNGEYIEDYRVTIEPKDMIKSLVLKGYPL